MAEQKYQIIRKLDAGGMAEVWQGKASSLRGFEKLVAIKRILPGLAENKKFISMFLDEARLSLYLNHANIVQTFDIGMSADAYFIVMEWVDGPNLRAVLETCNALGFRMPVEQATFIASEICKGLSHAHNRKDPKGRPLNIVHRDVSPPNMLLSRDGEIKIVDFGLAKAASQITSTDPGVVKGKFSYLSPEAAHGRNVDSRADVFAVGAVLYEMLAGRKLFYGESDLQTVELVRRAQIPPITQYNNTVADDLNVVLLKALARDPRDRYQTAEALGHALSRFLFSNRLMVTNYDIATLVRRVLATKEQVGDVTRVFSLEDAVQEEIVDFMSIENLDRMEFRSVLEQPGGDDSGMIGPGIDPRGWADEVKTSAASEAEETLLDGGGLARSGFMGHGFGDDDMSDATMVQSPNDILRAFGPEGDFLRPPSRSTVKQSTRPGQTTRPAPSPSAPSPPTSSPPASSPSVSSPFASSPAAASLSRAAKPAKEAPAKARLSAHNSTPQIAVTATRKIADAKARPADLSTPTGPHPMTRPRAPGLPLGLGVALGILGIAALGFAVWFLTNG
ncbi:MAG: serine/threonine protein kinase [Bradymonadia bacterium]|jgi:serine/threonine protein kinase